MTPTRAPAVRLRCRCRYCPTTRSVRSSSNQASRRTMLTSTRYIAADRPVSPRSLGGTCKHPDDLTKPLDTGNVWDRFIEGAYDPNSDTVSQRKLVLSHIALFTKFGYGGPYQEEAKAIA